MKRRNAGGFTLIETVISLILLSFITIIGYQGLIFGVNQWRNGHDKMQFQYDYHQAIGWMRTKIGTAEKVRKFERGSRAYQFTGTEKSVEFVARYDRSRRGGLYVSKVFLDQSDNRLYVSYYLHHPDVKPAPEGVVPQRVALLANVASIKLSYYGKKDRKGARWHHSWGNAALLPGLLKLEIETVDGVNFESVINLLTSNNA
jgi:type II secretory pathway pseudopilin PulG